MSKTSSDRSTAPESIDDLDPVFLVVLCYHCMQLGHFVFSPCFAVQFWVLRIQPVDAAVACTVVAELSNKKSARKLKKGKQTYSFMTSDLFPVHNTSFFVQSKTLARQTEGRPSAIDAR